MEKVFKQRRSNFLSQCLNYLKYVFNDHFVIVLFFLLGFILYQYKQLLDQFPKETGLVWLVMILLMLGVLFFGNVATYLLPADVHYLLVKESEVVAEVRKANRRSFILWGTLQSLFLVTLYPIFKALGLSVLGFVLVVVAMLLLRVVRTKLLMRRLIVNDRLNWRIAIAQETARQQAILKFFALFTRVKGITTSTKRRAYLDGLTRLVKRQSGKLWTNLYLRAVLRSGDYLGLLMRLTVLSVMSLWFINVPYLNVGVAFLFNYLLGFQLLALYNHYDYQYFTRLFPMDNGYRKANLLQFLRGMLYGVLVLDVIFSRNWQSATLLIVLMGLLVEGYLRYKVRKMID